MARWAIRAIRMCAVGGLVVAVGCRSSDPGTPYTNTPLLPGDGSTVVMGPSNPIQGATVLSGPFGPPPTPGFAPSTLTSTPPAVVATGPLVVPPILPPGANGPQSAPYALVKPQLPASVIATLPPPRDVTKGPEVPETPGTTLPALVVPPTNPVSDPAKLANNTPETLPTPKPSIIPGPMLDAEKPPEKDPFLSASRTITPPEAPVIIKAPVEETRPPATPAFPMKPGQKFGHDAAYQWIAGVLDYHQRGAYWTIRYADFAEDDRWGGKVRLVDDARLRDCKPGDIVYISGELLTPVSNASAENRTTFPPYRIGELKTIEKAK